ncbi:hypothetical protein FLACHUCJ7_01702 [Flavobacterium chungangense]|uniref:Uncharacterized protein n=1 Tax=Flavobacterium chungangense TaxID=554283 RepID=A0A6V6YXS2_9FLAO|nr:hypothetical protein FLACHUCJ7_01702 [Flavobacterium chungangense]
MAQLHSLNFESFRLSEVIPNYFGIFCYRYTVEVSVMINVAFIFKVKRE